MESKTYTLLSKEYSCEELSDVGRDVAEAFEYPESKEFLHLEADEHGFLPGTYKLLFVYVEEAQRDE